MHIETQRMFIRDYTMNDVKDLHDIFGDAEVMKNCEPAYDLEKTSHFLSEFCIEKRGAVAAVHKDSGKLIGYILFKSGVYDESVYEIAWIFNRDFWRQGYAYESCKAVIDYAFNELDAHKIFAETIDSVKSVGLMKKLGMQLEGIQRSQTKDNDGNWADLYFYGIFKDGWKRKPEC
ncbi:MAG: GNAT family N-acetyltransferase [Clostridiales bacterium]|nr:GNAT family N-acetyltransferase [Clostridiales bacterium]